MSIEYDKIKQLVKLVEKNRLSELTIEEEGLCVTIKADTPTPSAGIQVTVPHNVSACEDVVVEEMIVEEETPAISSEHVVEIKSPTVGVFYRCPSPDMPPYVSAGEHVEIGQPIGLIEAMKVFSEVPSEVAGRVVEVLVGNKELVQQGEVLVVVDTSDMGEHTIEQ